MADRRENVAQALRRAEILAGLDESTLADLAAAASVIRVPAGEVVYQQGDGAESLAVVQTGRLEAVDESDGEPTVIAQLTRGAVLGDLAILSGTPRSATVRAVRDSELLLIEGRAFVTMLTARPDLGAAVMRTIAMRLQQSRDRLLPVPRTAVLTLLTPAPDPSWPEVTAQLIARLTACTPVDVIEQDHESARGGELLAAMGRKLDSNEQLGRVTVLLVDDAAADPGWTAFCLRSADRVVVLTRGGTMPRWTFGEPRLQGRDLLLVGAKDPALIARSLASLAPRAFHFVKDADAASDIRRAARRVIGRSTGVVLSGGGARGLAHIGALMALQAAGRAPDRLGGTSMGALIGAMAARGEAPEEIRAALVRELVHAHPFNDYRVPRRSLIRGRKAKEMLDRLLGSVTIEQLDTPFFAVSADLATGERVVHRRGPLVEAVLASMAIPGLTAPVTVDGRQPVFGQ